MPPEDRSFDRCMDTRRIISNYLQGTGVSRAGQGWEKLAGVASPMRSGV